MFCPSGDPSSGVSWSEEKKQKGGISSRWQLFLSSHPHIANWLMSYTKWLKVTNLEFTATCAEEQTDQRNVLGFFFVSHSEDDLNVSSDADTETFSNRCTIMSNNTNDPFYSPVNRNQQWPHGESVSFWMLYITLQIMLLFSVFASFGVWANADWNKVSKCIMLTLWHLSLFLFHDVILIKSKGMQLWFLYNTLVYFNLHSAEKPIYLQTVLCCLTKSLSLIFIKQTVE